jgi:predicted aldo/keto reductase-like oxidoreductase
MLHNYSAFVEYERVMGPGGAFEGLLEAQKQGKTRFIGFTGHGCPVTMAAMRSGKFDVFVVPYNAAHREFGRALDLAAKLQAGVLVMKPLGASGLLKYDAKDPQQLPQTLTVAECLRYVLSHPGARVAIPNMSTMEHVKVALAAAATFKPLAPEEKQAIEAKVARVVGGVCSECAKPCDGACPNQVPVSLLMSRNQEIHRLYYDNRRQGDLYAVLPHDFMDCDRCGKCEEVCPRKFAIRSALEKYDATYREARYRGVLQFAEAYR